MTTTSFDWLAAEIMRIVDLLNTSEAIDAAQISHDRGREDDACAVDNRSVVLVLLKYKET